MLRLTLIRMLVHSNNVFPNLILIFLASRSQRAGVENAEALPNPWGSSAGSQQQQRAAGGGSNEQNPLAGLLGGLGGGGAGPNLFSPEMLNVSFWRKYDICCLFSLLVPTVNLQILCKT